MIANLKTKKSYAIKCHSSFEYFQKIQASVRQLRTKQTAQTIVWKGFLIRLCLIGLGKGDS